MRSRFLFLLVFIGLSACGGGSSTTNSGAGSTTSSKNNLILAIGDSISIGYNANIRFPDIVSSSTGIPVVNAGRGGISASEGVNNANSLIAQHNPRIIIAMLGTNDAVGGFQGAASDLQKLADICENNDILCVIGTLPPLTINSGANTRAGIISNGIRSIANARIADVRARMNSGNITNDGIHPNDTGQRIIGETFAAQIY